MAANDVCGNTALPAQYLPRRRFLVSTLVGLTTVTLMIGATGDRSMGDEVNPQATPYRQLLTPLTSVIDGKPFRDSIESIAETARLNVCIDRRVDPTARVHPGQLGPNVYLAIKKIAARRDCVVMPVANVLLVGRETWVNTTANSVIEVSNSGLSDLITVAWDDLTTPDEAVRLILGESSSGIDLPHDLWPRTKWTQMDRRVALALVLSQFDLRIDGDALTGRGTVDVAAAEISVPVLRRYRTGRHADSLRAALANADRTSKVDVDGNVLEVRATAAAHRLATAALLETMAAGTVSKPPDDDAVFSLRLKERAGAAITAFARRAGRKCLINPDAQVACETIVTLQAKEKTLRQLTEMVAQQANLVIEWTDQQVIVSKAP